MAIVENPHIYNMISETFNAAPEDISEALKWRQAFLEKRKEYNRKHLEKINADTQLLEASRQKIKEWFQNNKDRAAARQKARYENDPEYRRRLLEYKKMYYNKRKLRQLQQQD